MPKLRNSSKEDLNPGYLDFKRFRDFTAAELLLVVLMREELLA